MLPDLSMLCHGYYKDQLENAENENAPSGCAGVRFLLSEKPQASASWRPDPYFKGTLVTAANHSDGQQIITVVEGTIRSIACRRFCVDADGRPSADGMCGACRALPEERAFREHVIARHARLIGLE